MILSGGERIKHWNTRFGSWLTLIVFFISNSLWAAEMTPLPPVTVPPSASMPPEVVPPVPAIPQATLPPALPLGSSSGYAVTPPPPAVPPAPLTSMPSATPSPVVPPLPTLSTGIPTTPIPQPTMPLVPQPESPLLPPPTASLPPQIPMTAAPEATPLISQPLRPVSPETIAETAKKVEEEGVYFNVADEDLREVTKQISRALGKNFILDDKLKGKITIISERKMTKDEIWEAFQSALDVNGLTLVQAPAGLLRIIPKNQAISYPIDLYTGPTPFSDRFITRLITLKNISAADMANVIKGLVSKEGNLYAYPVTNTLILTDTGTNIDRLMRLINELDQEGPQEVLEIIPVVYADVKDLAGKITQIFETEKSGSGGAAAPAKKGQPAAAEIEEIPRLRKVIPDERTNSLIVLASKMAIQKVRDLIKRLDSPLAGDEGEVHVYYLKHAAAKDMAAVLTAISGAVQQGKDKGAPPGAAGAAAAAKKAAESAVSSFVGGAEFSGKFNVSADESTNALIITANAKDYNTLIDQVISKLDIPRKQVYVETVIVELAVSQTQNLGVGVLGGKQFNVNGETLNLFGSTFGFLDQGSLSQLAGIVGAGTESTRTLTTPGVGTTGNQITVPAFVSAIQLSQANSDVNILSTPNILTMDNQEAEIQVGQTVRLPQSTQPTTGGTAPFTTFSSEDVTLKLKIKPQINDGGTVRLQVTQDDRDIVPPQGPQAAGGSIFTTTKRSISTAIVARDGQTLVLGGLIKDKYSTHISKIPLLGDIPLLGYLFKTRTKGKEKVNLFVFLTPHIINEPRDFLTILQKKINEQNAFITQNYGKAQQKQIQKSLENHATHLLEFSGGDLAGTSRLLTEEERFPIQLDSRSTSPTSSSLTTSESNDLALESKTSRKKSRKKSRTTEESPSSSLPPPSGPSPTSNDDVDLAR